ncbi:signal peptide peptidase SppA [Massilia sp. DWR3-1-1]|uniref:signal peptide peptidase SppA n=1 Tax=Massilia sp. DWR3-1-1 TaxID=2804559 RepID=UPI003CF27AA6
MSFKPLSALRRGFGLFWRTLDATRRTFFNLLFLLILVVLVMALFSGGIKPLTPKTALVINLKGAIVEQSSGSVQDTLLANVNGESRRQVQLRDILTVLDAAATDKGVGSVVLMLEDLDAAGMAQLNDIGAAIDRVKAAGKPVVAWAGNYDQRQYLLASHATEVYLHPMGMVNVKGFGRYRNYYRDALDKVGVTVNLMKVGTYKSFAEPYIGNGPSDAAAEAEAVLYNALWQGYTASVEKSRKLPAGAINGMIDQLPQLMEAAGGDGAKVMLQAKLVDGLTTRDELRAMMIKRGEYDSDGKSFRQIGFDDYLGRHRPKVFGDAVGVVVASGEITDGSAGPGAIGGNSTSNQIRRAREDDQIKAVVLRVDSPGGSAFASELIRRELELTRAAGKPVIVSMGNVAASGGYWIAMAADEVIADPATITGSIGVFAILPTAEKVVDKLGVHTAGTTTTWLADAYNPLRPLDPRFRQLVQSSINHIYSEFTTRAASARKTTPAKIDAVGQGRVWTGAQARERGLVDRLGSYEDALKAAAARAKLPADYRVAYIERESNRVERFLNMFGASASQALTIQLKLGMLPTGLPASSVKEVARDMAWLSELNSGKEPFAAITHCLCSMP